MKTGISLKNIKNMYTRNIIKSAGKCNDATDVLLFNLFMRYYTKAIGIWLHVSDPELMNILI